MKDPDDEILDLVDENDNPKLIHREIGVILYDPDNKVLLQKRSLLKKANPGKWGFTAGHVTKGQTPLEAAHRETMEEVGISTDLEFIQKELHKNTKETRFVYWYKGLIPRNANIKLDPKEVIEVKIVSQSDVDEMKKSGEEITKGTMLYLEKFWSGKINI